VPLKTTKILACLLRLPNNKRADFDLYCMNEGSCLSPHEPKNAWSLGSYNEIALFFLPVSAHLVKLCNVSSDDRVLDVACGTGNTAITARRKGAKVTGIDFTPQMLTQAKAEATLAETYGMKWVEGDAEDLPFEDDSFDVVLSSFGHMFAPHPKVAIREMLRVIEPGGRIAFATWPPEHANGKVFEAMAKHMPPSPPPPVPPSASSSFSSHNHRPLPSPMQWGNPEVVKRRLGSDAINIHFERGVIKKPVLSPNHYWKASSTKGGALIQAIQTIQDPQKIESLRHDILQAILPYLHENVLTLDYLITVATKA
jgi:SAM-dependent methyltransferase